jgi:RNA recognition motif-containing protein
VESTRAESQPKVDSPFNDVTVIKDPRDLPDPGYDVGEEQPPYASGHQDVQTFTKLFVHNLDFNITKEGILKTFAGYGKIKYINFPHDNRNRPRGLAFVIFERHADAAKALKAGIRGIILGSRKLRIEIYKPLERLQKEKKEKAKKASGSDSEVVEIQKSKGATDSLKPKSTERISLEKDEEGEDVVLERSLSP